MTIRSSIARWGLVPASGLISSIAWAADPSLGRAFFQEQCAACHTAEADDNGGSQGPSLIGLFGRVAGSDVQFDYTQALRDSKLTWDAVTLNRFLRAPDTVVPGTAMVIPVSNQSDLDNLIAYFKSLATHR